MSQARASSLALVAPASLVDVTPAVRESRVDGRGSDRRAHARLAPPELTARLKYGEDITLVDLSVGGALVETTRILRPDTDLVLEILDSRTKNVTQVVSRVLRSRVAALSDGVRYRGACAFKKPISHPSLTEAPAPLLQKDVRDFLKLEFALKTIVEGYFKQPAASGATGRWRDASALIDALVRLRAAAERRDDDIDRRLGQLLAALIPALQRRDPAEALMERLQNQLSKHLPLLAIRASGQPAVVSQDRELVTLNVAAEPDQPQMAITAEFPAGFGLDESQFRLLKAGAYLVGLVGHWREATPAATPVTPAPRKPQTTAATSRAPEIVEGDLPFGWHRIVVRYVDGQLLRGYSNDFHPDRAHLHLCPALNCAADERLLVPIGRLKAVFFVKTLDGDRDGVDERTFDHQPRARKVEVTFRDGEVMLGSTLNYKPNGQGFFLQPANSQSNNTRVYIITPAIRHMRFVA